MNEPRFILAGVHQHRVTTCVDAVHVRPLLHQELDNRYVTLVDGDTQGSGLCSVALVNDCSPPYKVPAMAMPLRINTRFYVI